MSSQVEGHYEYQCCAFLEGLGGLQPYPTYPVLSTVLNSALNILISSLFCIAKATPLPVPPVPATVSFASSHMQQGSLGNWGHNFQFKHVWIIPLGGPVPYVPWTSLIQ